MAVPGPPPFPPIEPPPPRVRFPDPSSPSAPEVLAVGCDFTPSTVLLAYRSGIFPWPHGTREDGESEDDVADEGGSDPETEEPLVLWFSPNPRAVLPLDHEPHWSRSLRRTLRRHPYYVTLDQDFGRVMRMCGETRKNKTWIIPELVHGYQQLHALGWAHSVEVWERAGAGRTLVGGIYGLALGELFVGESMFHVRTDASKIAFASLAMGLRASGFQLLDVQVQNPHLESLGCVEIPRAEYLARMRLALRAGPRTLALASPRAHDA